MAAMNAVAVAALDLELGADWSRGRNPAPPAWVRAGDGDPVLNVECCGDEDLYLT
jgi:hypothetical protein